MPLAMSTNFIRINSSAHRREHAPIFLSLLFREEPSRSMELSRQKEKKEVCILNPLLCIVWTATSRSPGQLENCWQCWVWASWTVSKKASKGQVFKKKNCLQRALWAINIKTGAALIAAKGTKVKPSPCSSAGLLYLWIPWLLPSLPPISEVSDRRHSASEKPSTQLLLANCGVLFRAYMSAQAVIVSVIITTCSLAAFRSHHLGSIKQPAAGSSADCPGAATGRLWVSEGNCRLCTNSPGLSPPRPLPRRKRSPAERLTGTRILQAEQIRGASDVTFMPWIRSELSHKHVILF